MKREKIIICLAMALMLGSCGSKGESKEEEKVVPVEKETKVGDLNVGYRIENGMIIPGNNRPAIVDFSAVWCPPCRQLKPIFESLAEEFKGKVDFITIDVDSMPQLAAQYGVTNIPMILYMSPTGEVLTTTIGFIDESNLKHNVESLLHR